ncbi:MAG: SPFH domain-containing protein [Clostridiales bacterium]|nr:SPFH domain-containing protein [Clostridiales bacterium]
MGFFDKFKKSEPAKPAAPAAASAPAPAPAPAEQKAIGIKFGTQAPIPFRDPTYGPLYINAYGSATLVPLDPQADPNRIVDMAKMNILDQLNQKLFDLDNTPYDSLSARSDEICADIAKAISSKFKIQTMTIDSIEPDEMSRKMIEQKKIAMDPQLAAKKMQEAVERARASAIAAGYDPDEMANRPMPNFIADAPTTLPTDPEELMKQMKAIQAAASGAAILGFCEACGKPFSKEGFCENCGAPVAKKE